MSALPGDPSFVPLNTTDAIDHIHKMGHYTYDEASALKNILAKIRDLKNNKDEYNKAFKHYLVETFGDNAFKIQSVFQSFSVKFAQSAAAAAHSNSNNNNNNTNTNNNNNNNNSSSSNTHPAQTSNQPPQHHQVQQQEQPRLQQQQYQYHQQQLQIQQQQQQQLPPRPMLPLPSQQMKPLNKAKSNKQKLMPIEENEIDKELEKPSERLNSDLGDYIKTTDTAITYDIITDDLVQEEEEISKYNLRESIIGSLGVDSVIADEIKKKQAEVVDDDVMNIESSGNEFHCLPHSLTHSLTHSLRWCRES